MATDDLSNKSYCSSLLDLHFSCKMTGLALTLWSAFQPQGPYLSPHILLQQHHQLDQLNQQQFQELELHHRQAQMLTHHHHHHQQQPPPRLSKLEVVDEDACSASSSYNSPTGSVANQSLASTCSENQLDSASFSAANGAAAASALSTAPGSSAASTSSAKSRHSSATASAATGAHPQPSASGGQRLPHRKRRYKVQMPDADEPFLCRVCGDKALGFNFDAITCESCKAFFRRNALKNKKQKCNFAGECEISRHTRKFCSACRLKKCFLVGMKSDWILNPDELKERNQHRVKGKKDKQADAAADSEHQQPQQQQPPPPQASMPLFKLEHNPGCCSAGKCGGSFHPSFVVDSTTRQSTSTFPPPPPPPPPPVPSTSTSPNVGLPAGARPSVLAFLREEEPEPAVPRWSDRRPLSPISAAIIGAIRAAINEVMNNVDGEESEKILSATTGHVRLEAPFAITLSFVQRFVLFVKQLPEYSLIQQDDMVRLIKGGVFHFILMRGVSIYNPVENVFSFVSNRLAGHHALSLDCLARSLRVYPNGEELLRRYQQFMADYRLASDGDPVALTLLQLIEFYNPCRPSLDNREQVDRIQQGYMLLLRRYIQNRFPCQVYRRVYLDLMNRLSELEDLAKEFSQLCHVVGFPCQGLDPLLIEVFELQQQRQQQQGPAEFYEQTGPKYEPAPPGSDN